MALLDTGVRYAEPSDVERFIRNKEFDGSSDPTQSTVQKMLLEASDEVDRMARRAWRLREKENVVRDVEFSHNIEAAYKRRYRRSRRSGFVQPINKWGLANLPRARVTSIESLVLLLPESTEDITANEGRDADWYLDERAGSLYVDAEKFKVGPLRGSGLLENPQVEVTFRYGEDEQGGTSTEAVSSSVPDRIRRATAKMVAAELIETDQYGSVVASGPENVPDQSVAAQRLRTQAEEAIDSYRIKKVM